MQQNIIIGSNIKKWRSFKGYKQEHFARKLGISRSTLSKYENGHSAISFIQLQQIATHLGVPLHDLVSPAETISIQPTTPSFIAAVA